MPGPSGATYTLKIQEEFSAAHYLANHPGKCSRLHGHAWRVEAVVVGKDLDEIGCVVDFAVLKSALRQATDSLDHRLLNELPPFREVNPTAENLSAYFYGEMRQSLGKLPGIRLEEVTVWESGTASSSYREE